MDGTVHALFEGRKTSGKLVLVPENTLRTDNTIIKERRKLIA
jgi:hypothetical protein